jgi:hypothetical protein
MEFKSDFDIHIASKLLKYPLLSEEIAKKWRLELHREFNMTDDAFLFHKNTLSDTIPLYEGKMIFQFTHSLAEPRFWISEKEGRKAVLGKVKDAGQLLGYEKFRLAYRSIASNTNERSLICTIIPPCFTGNSLNVSENLDNATQLFCVSIFNSFVIDWLLRRKVTTNINMFYIYQLPIPRFTEKDPAFKLIIECAARLICTTPEFDDLAKEIGLSGYKKGVTNEVERARLRAELDGLIAHLYGLTEEEFAYILTTFPLVPDPVKVAALNAYRDVEQGLIK